MNPEFKEWLSKQKYDWDISYNSRVRTDGRIWMLKNVYNHYYILSPKVIKIMYSWEEVINASWDSNNDLQNKSTYNFIGLVISSEPRSIIGGLWTWDEVLIYYSIHK